MGARVLPNSELGQRVLAMLAEQGGPAGPPASGADGITVTVPVRTKNPTNTREQWWAVARRAKAEHAAVFAALAPHAGARPALAAGCRVELTRVSCGRVDRFNLGATLKGVIDAVAMWLLGGTPGRHDEDPRIEWAEPKQLRSGRNVFGVIVTIRPRATR